MKKITFSSVVKLLFALPCLMMATCFALLLFGQYLYLHPFSTKELCYLSFCSIVFLFIVCCCVDWCRDPQKWYKRALKIVCTLLVILFVALLLLIPAAFHGLFGSYDRCDSPDGQHRLVFEAQAILAVERGTVYEMTSPVTMKKVASLDGPFHPLYHEIIWHDTYVELVWRGEILRFDYTNA